MAKAKSGGTRSYLRGRIANDVYSIGKDGSGKKQQVVRSMAETVTNPQTIAQMRGRMIMSTVMQGLSALHDIIDHSFDGIAAGQQSLNRFIKVNYALAKDAVEQGLEAFQGFFFNDYQQKGIAVANWLIAEGKQPVPSFHKTSEDLFAIGGNVVADMTFGAWLVATHLDKAAYFTVVGIAPILPSGSTVYVPGVAAFVRLHIKEDADRSTVITSANFNDFFTLEDSGNILQCSLRYPSEAGAPVTIMITPNGAGGFPCSAYTIIQSVKKDDGYEHNDASFIVVNSQLAMNTPQESLDTYPIGSERFLNGGSL